MRRHKKTIKLTTYMLLVVLIGELIKPATAAALTTGPTQPEMQSFEPVGTTDMVDMFSGDFVYNIPLMDVEGYPINISYHGGVTMEQEASWVGLGWNINPGEINRTVRGVPDDFNGDTLSKELHIKDEKTLRVGIGVGGEVVGCGDPFLSISASFGANVNISNYRGVSCDLSLHSGINVCRVASEGINIGVGSQSGGDIDYDANLTLSTALIMDQDIAAGIGAGVGMGYNTRSGVKDISLSFSETLQAIDEETGRCNGNEAGNSFGASIPIGVKNFVPVITNSSTMSTIYGRIKIGFEDFWCLPYGTINAGLTTNHYNDDGSKDAYGYMYMENAQQSAPGNTSILDFTRDKDGMFNRTMQYLPPASMTYDIYSVSGQGTGGMFRPFRNDFGSVFDPVTYSSADSRSLGLEVGIGNIFEIGGDLTQSTTEITSGPWTDYLRSFATDSVGGVFEKMYLKQGGELTAVDPQYFNDIGGFSAIDPTTSVSGLPFIKANSSIKRDARANLVYYFTADEEQNYGTDPDIISYISSNGFDSMPSSPPATQVVRRVGAGPLDRKSDQLSEIVQLQKDGRKYIYGLPALNHLQKEATFSVAPPSSADMAQGLVSFSPGTDDATTNNHGLDNYYSSTETPSYVHSFLLTSVLSSDYVDVTGDGVTDDDLGSYTQLHYSLKDNDYRWRAPFDSNKAQYNPGFWIEPRDDKGSYVCGSREQWMLHSVETRNFIAEFYTSQRNDGCGSTAPVTDGGKYNVSPYNAALITPGHSYELDSIKLFNKHDRFINGPNAVPVKSVYFVYSDSLCPGIPNAVMSGPARGKLTLSKIFFSYGNSQKSMMSPYQFTYGFNPSYDLSAKDRWGNYKPNNASFTNYEFPFVNQNDTADNTHATAWSLTNIYLPSGGIIQANYESDDYAFVQDQPANEMFMVQGIGNGPSFNPSNQLYANVNSPYLYLYFKRRTGSESPSMSTAANYFKTNSLLYYNMDIKLINTNATCEPIKGYAQVQAVGVCTENSAYGYVQLQPVTPTGTAVLLNPACYTALNTARYELPQFMFPGSDPSASDLSSVLAGLRGAFGELMSITQNPIVRFVNKGYAKSVNLNKSFIRLQNPGLHKKGGGQRVKSLLFFDSWNALAGGNEQTATYGKNYDYTIQDDTYGNISSGVASYEPLIGGDENPLRQPIPYVVQSGSNFPPNDPVTLYQETPIGESLYPPGSVGYRKVSVTSIHSDVGKSSQGLDVYQFYTAKDFPAQFQATAINSETTYHFDLFSQENTLKATQGYSLTFNDMHGKPKSVEHYVIPPNSDAPQIISYQTYNYKTSGSRLDNHVKCLVYDHGTSSMITQVQQLGVESDLTIDTRQKNEKTDNSTYNMNLNVSAFGFFVIPIPYAFPWGGEYHNEFQSATVTKVIQQYGILDNVQAFNEGATTMQKNELFDPITGQVIVTSINNEYHDKEYSTTIPAYWCYAGMEPAYTNIKLEGDIPWIAVNSSLNGFFIGANNLHVGDELMLDYVDGSNQGFADVFVMGNISEGAGCNPVIPNLPCCGGYLLPRFPTATTYWNAGDTLKQCHFLVVQSGARNMLNQTAESYKMFGNPVNSSGQLKMTFDSLISISATTYCDSNTRILHNYLYNADTINPFVTGERGVFRPLNDFVYIANRNYSGTTARTSGLFSANGIFEPDTLGANSCVPFPYNYFAINLSDSNWHAARTVTKWSPFGKEVENIDAVGNFSTAVYGYNQDLPVAVASNANQGEVLAEGFEDYSLLQVPGNIMNFNYSTFNGFFAPLSLGATIYSLFNLTGSNVSIVSGYAHTGMSSLSIDNTVGHISGINAVPLPINTGSYSGAHDKYNSYFLDGVYNLSSVNEYLTFGLNLGKQYILSFWVEQNGGPGNTTDYSLNDSCGVVVNSTFYPLTKKSNLIDGWQQVEVTFTVAPTATTAALRLPVGFYVDDVRFYPSVSNMKAFVYNPVTEKLMATLDENNFGTLYEYDQEGNLVRVKRETEKGIMTISESRSGNPKK